MDITREDFIYLTSNGYRLSIGDESESKLYTTLAEYVNGCDNNFFAEALENKTILHAGMRTEVCVVTYEEGLVRISSLIDQTDDSSLGEFSSLEEHQILGMACMGVIKFCDYFAELTGQSPDRKINISKNEVNLSSTTDISDKKLTSKNTKYNAWPM